MHTAAVWEEWGVPALEPKVVTAPLFICLVSTLCVHLSLTLCAACVSDRRSQSWFLWHTVFLDLNVSAQSQSTILTSRVGGELSDMKYSDEALQQWGRHMANCSIFEFLNGYGKKKCSGANQPEEMGWISCSLKRLLECLWTVKQCLPLCWQHRLN